MDKNKISKLLRLKKFKLEEEQLKLSILERRKQDLLQQIRDIEECALKERAFGSKMHNVGNALEYYMRRVEIEKSTIKEKITAMAVDIETAREDVNKAFIDKKSIEKVIEKIEDKEKIIGNRQEQKKMDELVGNDFFKK